MAEYTTITLNADQHVQLDQSLLRLPLELNRKNCRSARLQVEKERDAVLQGIKNAVSAAAAANEAMDEGGGETDSAAAETAARTLDGLISRMHGLKRKLVALHDEEQALHSASRRRIEHLEELYSIPSLADVKYDEWSNVRLSRLLVDYLLRSGYTASARALATEKKVEELVDIEPFELCRDIETSLLGRRTQDCLAWCLDNRQALKKINHGNLEFQLRLQQYIEVVRVGGSQKHVEAAAYARKYLAGHWDSTASIQAAGLLAFPPSTQVEPYKTLFSAARWSDLATLFLQTYHELLSLPSRPLLNTALSAGLTALKTPACHSEFMNSYPGSASTTTSVCPICSTELNELALSVPYAQHAKSYVEADPVVLPNGRIYSRERLTQLNEKLGTERGRIVDPTDRSQVFDETEIKKVFIM